jgi:hypothetical protein
VHTFFQPTIGPLPGWQEWPMTISAHRTRLIWSPLVGWVMLSCSLTAVNAQSPTQSEVDPTTSTPSVPPGGAVPPIVVGLPPGMQPKDPALVIPTVPSVGTTIVNAPAGTSVPYYGGIGSSVGPGLGIGVAGGEGIGIGLGPFILVPQLEINVGVDSNVFAEGTNPTGSMFTAVSPSFDLRSDWLNHSLHVLATSTLGWYGTAPTQNYQNYALLVDGKVDVHSDMYITAATGFRRATEALGTPNVAFAQAPTVVDTLPIEIIWNQDFNRIFYQAGARATRFWYYDNSTITSGGLPASSRARFEYGEFLRIGYHVNEDLDVFIAPTLSQIRYIDKINAAGQQRDSDGINVGLGATWKLNEVSILEGQVGYQTTAFGSASGLGTTPGWTYSLRGTYTGYGPLTLRPYITRSINETALSNYKNYVATTVAFDFTYLIHDAWTLAGGALLTVADYNPVDGLGVNPRTDNYWRGQIGVLYSIRPEVQIGPFFEYSRGSSTDPTGPNYDRQIFSVRLIAKR